MKIELRKDLAYYMALPYTIVLRNDEERDTISRIEELPGCVAHGANATKSLARLREAPREHCRAGSGFSGCLAVFTISYRDWLSERTSV